MIGILTVFLNIFGISFSGLSNYPKLIKTLISEVAPSTRVKCIKDYNKKIKAKESTVLNFMGLMEQYNRYKAQEYKVTTDDGYILRLHRVTANQKGSKNKKKPVVYIQHGIGGSSDFFIVFGDDQALVFQLADAGYDVWLGNVRGNTYSRSHEKFDPKDPQFWAFGLDEIAAYDVSKSIDFILNKTGRRSLTFIGYSMGTTVSYMLLSTKPEYNKKINLLISVAPIVYSLPPTSKMLSVVSSTLLYLTSFAIKMLKTKKTGEVLPQSAHFEKFGRESCSGSGFNGCKMIIKMVGDLDNVNTRIIPRIMGYIPAGISYYVLKHYRQLMNSGGKFQKYDYDSCGWFDYACLSYNTTNKEKYNQTTPPEYDLSLITTPNVIVYSKNDGIALFKDVEHLICKLSNVIAIEKIPDELRYNHLDFFSHKDSRRVVYNRMLQIIGKYAKC